MKHTTIGLAILLAACSPKATDSKTPTTAAATQGDPARVHHFHIGALEAMALRDGDIHVPNDGKVFGLGHPPDETAKLLTAAGKPADTIDLSIQPLLVRDGERTLLFDSGAADASFAKAGHLSEALQAAAVAATQVTDVFVTHGHPDHVGGLVTRDGKSAFPKARIHIASPEWGTMQKNTELAKTIDAIGTQVDPFQPNASILPNVIAVEIRGHTAGHTGYRIGAGSDSLLLIGDSAHHSVISIEKPEWPCQFDKGGDPPLAQQSRRALLERAAKENLRLYSEHFPWPGIGHVQTKGDAFVWVPEKL